MRRTGQAPRRGFTFVEVMIVVAIIGVLSALAVSGWNRAGVKRDIHNAVSDLESAVRTARNIAAVAGGAIGSGALNLDNCAVLMGGGSAPEGDVDHISILIDGPNLQLVAPIRLEDAGGGAFRTTCDTIDLNNFNSEGLTAELLAGADPNGVVTIAFSQMGRPYSPPNAPVRLPPRWNVGVRTVGSEAGLEEGFQILSSGVMCRRKLNGVTPVDPVACDEN